MYDYLITGVDAEWFDLHKDQFKDVLRPNLIFQNRFRAGVIIAFFLDAKSHFHMKTPAL
jgi:hypothetical protein